MATQSKKTIDDVANETQYFSVDAFEFLREGLDFTVQRKHGPAVESLRSLIEWLDENGKKPADLTNADVQSALPGSLRRFIEQIGGAEEALGRINLHVDGRELCWGLRDLAMERWGYMAPAVLQHWGVRSTKDFGRMVFALVDNGLLQKQPHDNLGDFEKVFDFHEAFDGSYRIGATGPARKKE